MLRVLLASAQGYAATPAEALTKLRNETKVNYWQQGSEVIRSDGDEKPTLFFKHMRKAAGTSLVRFFNEIMGSQSIYGHVQARLCGRRRRRGRGRACMHQ